MSTRSTLSTLFVLLSAATLVAQRPAAELTLLDAVRTAMARHPALAIEQQQVAIAGAQQQQAAAPFDEVLSSGLDRGRVYSPLATLSGFDLAPTDTSQLDLSYSKLLKNGMSFGGTLGVQRQIGTGAIRDGLTTSSTRLQLVAPLLRGRGLAVTTAGQRAAGLQRDSAELELRQTTATVMARVVSSYWSLVAAERSRRVAAESVERGERLVESTRALIAADQSPRGNLASALANAADRHAAQFVADQVYVEARQRLLLDMGLRPEEFADRVVLEDFSILGVPPDPSELPSSVEPMIEAALLNRADYLSAQRRVEAARISRDAARNSVLPQVDFTLTAGYTALAEGRALGGYLAAVAKGLAGPDLFGSVSYRFPTRNSLAVGRLSEADAHLERAQLQAADTARVIRSSVITSYGAVRNALLRLDKAHESVAAFQDALIGEQDKVALGIGSLVNLLTIEDRLTAAADREVAAWRSYGQALVEFRFATGLLAPADGPVPALAASTFTTLPLPSAAGRPQR
jgi:outer membrane protein TolC